MRRNQYPAKKANVGVKLAGFLLAAGVISSSCGNGNVEPTIFPDSAAAVAALDIDTRDGELDKSTVEADIRGAIVVSAEEFASSLTTLDGLVRSTKDNPLVHNYVSIASPERGEVRITTHNYIDDNDGVRKVGLRIVESPTTGIDSKIERNISITTDEAGVPLLAYSELRHSEDVNGDEGLRFSVRIDINPDHFSKTLGYLIGINPVTGEREMERTTHHFDTDNLDGHTLNTKQEEQRLIEARARAITEAFTGSDDDNGFSGFKGFIREADSLIRGAIAAEEAVE